MDNNGQGKAQLYSKLADSTFLVDHEYDCAGNSGSAMNDDRGLHCTKEPPDKGFHSDNEVTTNLACVRIDSIEMDLQVEVHTHSGIVTRSKSRKQSLLQISYD
ncbi:unnamed protein product [Ilex paraguariensis]|uniref:Uncharacterized protein n=1 Tax=Ilex paraguariensis TaxID=185542 RepID=A0ABC8QT97_9AQUA